MNIGVILLSVCLNCCAQLFIRKGMLQVGEMNMLSRINLYSRFHSIRSGL